MQAHILETTDPTLNLAIEELLVAKHKQDSPDLLLLWQNAPSVIIGRHQCTEEVIQTSFVADNSIPVVRRMTGGGAVYHDLGNLNFSFITSTVEPLTFEVKVFLEPLLAALRQVGIEAQASGRNDLEVLGKKISGTSQLRLGQTVLFHGTLLVNLDLAILDKALAVDPAKIHSKGVQSIAARVVNLSTIWPQGTTLENLKDALLTATKSKASHLPQELEVEAIELANKKYRTWDWNYGASPPFTIAEHKRFPWGLVSLKVNVRKGLISSWQITGDFISLKDPEELAKLVLGKPWDIEILSQIFATQPFEAYFVHCDPKQMLAFFTGAIRG